VALAHSQEDVRISKKDERDIFSGHATGSSVLDKKWRFWTSFRKAVFGRIADQFSPVTASNVHNW
jgi:hypothetical protein